MSKKVGLGSSSVFFLFVFSYLAYESNDSGKSLVEFMLGYLDNPQKYLFLVNIIIFPFIYFLQRPITVSMIKIRLQNNTFLFILKDSLYSGFILSCFIYFSSIILGVMFGMDFVINVHIANIFFKLTAFIFCCYIFSYAIYFAFNKLILGALSVLVLNFVYLILIYSINFYILNNSINDNMFSILLYAYMFFLFILSVCYLHKRAEIKECLQ